MFVATLLPPRLFAAEKKPTPQQTAQGLALFKNDVRLILAHHCVDCHGGTETEGELDMTTREGLLKGGGEGKAIVPFSAEKSRLVRLITHAEKPHMPEDKEKLPADQIAKITRWINLGAPYDKPLIDPAIKNSDWTKRKIPADGRKYWAFVALKRVEPPKVKNAEWCRTPIDRFVMRTLEAKGLAPNDPVGRRKLIRRVYFDLIGLPPTPEEIEKFVADKDPQAYEKLLDQLLANEHYGERWASHWLDVARFAESHGFEQDYDRPFAFHYRDFVIKALNQDMPYNQFVRWQLAGDEIAPDNSLAMMATGFLGAGVFPTQITANEVERTRYDALDDMASTTGTAMLGLSVGCARCHDHKYDPIPSADYYKLLSTFTTTVRSNIDLETGVNDPKARAAWDKKQAELTAVLSKFEAQQLPARLKKWEASHSKTTQKPKWAVLDPLSAKSQGGAKLTKQGDGSLLASGTSPDLDTYTFVVHTDLIGITAIKLEALAHKSMVRGGPGRAGNGNFALTDFRVTAAPKNGQGKPLNVKLTTAKATFEQPNLFVRYAIDADKKSAWAVDPQFGKDHAAVFETAGNVGFSGGTVLTFTLDFKNNSKHTIGRPRLSITTAPRPVSLKGGGLPQNITGVLALVADKRTKAQSDQLLGWYRVIDPQWQKLNATVAAHAKTRPQGKKEKVMVCSEGFKPIRHHTQGADFFKQTYFLRRGDCGKKEGTAQQSFLQALTTAPDGAKHWQIAPPKGSRTSYRRRALAGWITDTEYGAGNLLARVIVNRLWQHHTGRGIVATPNDFGRQGQPPTHPQLLDWLASELMQNQWRLKPMHKLMMTSAVYMQGTQSDAADLKIDPSNQYHWRRSPRRLEAEAIRDSMLAIGGQLDERMFGKGTLDQRHKRRSIYFTIKRSKLIPVMQLFDASQALVSIGERPSTTIAPQALSFMNSPQVRSYADGFAKRLAPMMDRSPAEAVDLGYATALGRPPSAEERADMAAFLKQQIASYDAAKKPNSRHLALTDLCQVLFSLNEFVYPD